MKKQFLILLIAFSSISLADNREGVISREERCQIARNNVAKMSDFSRTVYVQENGDKRSLSYQERNDLLSEQEEVVKQLCGNTKQEIEVRSATAIFGNRLINRVRTTEILDSIYISLLNAIVRQDVGEIYTIMKYVLGINEEEVYKFITTVQNNPAQAEQDFRNKYKSKNIATTAEEYNQYSKQKEIEEAKGKIPKRLFGKNGEVDLSKFTDKIKNVKGFKEPKTGWRIEKDETGHGAGSKWKLKDNKGNGNRIATLDEKGFVTGK
ncbi:MAG: hypothetical protein IJ566_04715 [Cardiobacteriaceae bacterium]|nr:hypothetical protein [Cardiobacteriaceae bacterium]